MPYERTATFQPPGIGLGTAETHSSLADALSQFGDTVERVGSPIVADLGARAGAQAGADRKGGTRVPVGPYNRAYNESFLRSYTLDVYADSEKDFLRLEQEANGDPTVFQTTATARRDSLLSEVLPEARAFVRATIDDRMALASTRLNTQALAKAEEERQTMTVNGLDAMRRDASRALTSGTEEGTKRGVAIGMQYGSIVDQSVKDGIFTPVQGRKLIDAALKSNSMDVYLGMFESQAQTPGGDPVKIIRDVLESDDPNFDDDDRQRLSSEMMRRLGMRKTMAAGADADEWAGQQILWKQSEQEGASRLIGGTLTSSWIKRQVDSGKMDPSLGMTLYGKLDEGSASEDNESSLLDLAIRLPEMTIPEVLALPGLSTKTVIDAVGKISSRQASWRDSNSYQEGRRTIATAVGVSLENIGLADDEAKNLLSLALTQYDRGLESLPPELRDESAVQKSDEIVRNVIRGGATKQIAKVKESIRRNVQRTLDAAGVTNRADLSEESQAEVQRYLDRQTKVLIDLEKQRAGQ